LLGIIGHPLGHTLSPRLQAAFLAEAGLSGTYEVWDTSPEGLSEKIEVLKRADIDGFNVTIPYKTAIMDFLDVVDPLAKTIGAVNTVVKTSSGWHGFNTDCDGFWDSLPEHLQQLVKGGEVVLLGAGGAARAVGAAMIRAGAQTLVLVVRDLEKAGETLKVLNACAELFSDTRPEIRLVSRDELNGSTCQALINTTPVGMTGDLRAMPLALAQMTTLPHTAWVIDLIYKPRPTQLLQVAQSQGYETLDGLGMLVHQGARAFTHWTGAVLSQAYLNTVFSQIV
jgi:shikimate dehydrogenase